MFPTLLCVACACSLCFVINRKKQPQRKHKRDRNPFQLDDIPPPPSSVDTSASSTNPAYQGNIRYYLSMHSTKALRELLFFNTGIEMHKQDIPVVILNEDVFHILQDRKKDSPSFEMQSNPERNVT